MMNSLKQGFLNFKNIQKTEKTFYISILGTFLFGVYLMCWMDARSLFAFLLSVATFGVLVSIIYLSSRGNWFLKEIMTYILFFLIMFHLPAFFLGSARINHSRKPKDQLLVKFDDFFFGKFWEKGQFSLFLDKNVTCGPQTKCGIIIGDILQIFYFMYYIFPYGCIYFYPLIKCIIYTYKKKKDLRGIDNRRYRQNWYDLYFITSVYIFTYLQVFLLNTFIPAKSPRLFLQNEYENPLTLTGIAKIINENAKDDKSANSFPSGHVAETLCIAFALLAMRKKILGIFVLISAHIILLATLWLRYHYMIDVIFAYIITIIAFATCYLNYDPNSKFEEEEDETTMEPLTNLGNNLKENVEV